MGVCEGHRLVMDEITADQKLPAEIDEVLREFDDEMALRHYVVRVLGGLFRADWDGGTYRVWLQQIADRVRGATAR